MTNEFLSASVHAKEKTNDFKSTSANKWQFVIFLFKRSRDLIKHLKKRVILKVKTRSCSTNGTDLGFPWLELFFNFSFI